MHLWFCTQDICVLSSCRNQPICYDNSVQRTNNREDPLRLPEKTCPKQQTEIGDNTAVRPGRFRVPDIFAGLIL